LTQPTPDRLKVALKRTNRALNPRSSFALEWEYRVATVTPGPPVKISCVAVDLETLGSMPAQISDMTLWPGPSGFVAMPPPGSIVRLSFRNGDPTRPMITGLDPSVPPTIVFGYATTSIQLGDQTATPLVRELWAADLTIALTVFATGLNPTTLAAQATALVAALAALPPPGTLKVLGT
jgi:hypothetical protein